MKIGDKVKIKSKDWFDNQPKNEIGGVEVDQFTMFSKDMKFFLGREAVVKAIFYKSDKINHYVLKEGDYVLPFNFSDGMFV